MWAQFDWKQHNAYWKFIKIQEIPSGLPSLVPQDELTQHQVESNMHMQKRPHKTNFIYLLIYFWLLELMSPL